jgi:RNA ligase (TIGR02306 family)
MSKLTIEACAIDDVLPHPNGDKLALAIVKGWQVVIKKGEYVPGELTVYLPPDSIVPVSISDQFGFTQYLRTGGRVKAVNLRGQPSHGVLIKPTVKHHLGQDVAEYYGITKYVPPPPPSSGGFPSQQEADHHLFWKYTDIDNMRHYPAIIADGDEVVMTEKLHGTNCRSGFIEGEMMAGSRNRRVKPLVLPLQIPWYSALWNWLCRREPPTVPDIASMKQNWFWFPWTLPQVHDMLHDLGHSHKQVILYGEVFGKNIQKGVSYHSPDDFAYRAFDLVLEGSYVDYDAFVILCQRYGVPMVPILYRGPFSLAKAKEMSEGKTTMGDTHIREGTVIKPVIESFNPKIGRVILKYVGDQFLLAKDIGDYEEQ